MEIAHKSQLRKTKLFSAYRFLSSGKILPIIILVVLPAAAILLYGLSYFVGSVALAFSLFVMTILYAPYRAAYSTEEYFKRRGYENVISEYFVIKYILYFAIPMFLFLTIISLRPGFERYFDAVLGSEIVDVLRLLFFCIVIAGLTKTMLQVARKEFRLYFAVGCIRVLARREDEIDMMKYLIWGLNAYNAYLRRYLNLEINNLKKIYSKISSSPLTKRIRLRDSLDASFDHGKLSKYLSPEEKEQLLVKESFPRKIKEAAAFMAIVVPILISLSEFLGLLPRNLTSGGG
jgi:hypothetical protein